MSDDSPSFQQIASGAAGIVSMANPVAGAALGAIATLIPELGAMFGSGSASQKRNISAATAVAQTVVTAAKAVNEQDAYQRMTGPGGQQVIADVRQALASDPAIAALLSQMAQHELALAAARDTSSDKAAARGQKDSRDIAPQLATWGDLMFGVTTALVLILIGVQMWFSPTHEPNGVLIGLATILIYAVARYAERPRQYRFGGLPDQSQTLDTAAAVVKPK